MRAGRLNTKILIESKSSTPNEYGENVETWSTFGNVWAEVKNNSGKEFLNAKQINNEVSQVITIRYLSGVNTSMRVNINGSYSDILSVFEPMNRKTELKLYCRERV